MVEQELDVRPETQRLLPQIVYDRSLENAPYTVSVDAGKYAEFLRFFGMNDQDIAKQKVVLKHNGGFGIFEGVNNSLSNTTVIFLGLNWFEYKDSLELANEISEGKKKPKKGQFAKLLHTKRLGNYLSLAPRERGKQFAEKLLTRALEREQNSLLAHESKHSLERRRLFVEKFLTTPVTFGVAVAAYHFADLFKAVYGIGDIPDTDLMIMVREYTVIYTLLLFYLGVHNFEPGEIRANKFGKQVANDPRWRDILKITPKSDLVKKTVAA